MDKTLIARLMHLGLALAIIAILSGCTMGARTGSLCTAGPIILDQGASDRLTREEKEQIVALNQSGETICGWKAP
jgi:hypothetical protein